MSYIDKIQLGDDTYKLQSDGVANPQDSTQSVIATQVINSVNISTQINTERTVDFPASGWSKATGSEFWVNTVSMPGVTSDSKPIMVGIVYPESSFAEMTRDQTRKAVQKAAGYLYQLETNTDVLKLYATRQPEVILTIAFRGLNTTT